MGTKQGPEMPDVSVIDIKEIMALPVGGIGLFFALRYLIPWLKATMNGATQRTIADTQNYLNLEKERDRAVARAEAAEDRADKLFADFQKLQAEMSIITYQMQMANERINSLRSRLAALNAPTEED